MRTLTCLSALIAFLPISAFALSSSSDSVHPAAPATVTSFDLNEVVLGPGPFRDARERDRAYMLSLDPDRLLHTFRLNVGFPSSAQPYGGWEGPSVELRGHSMGHYLSACSLMYRSTGDLEFKRRVDYIVAELAKCQAAAVKAGFHEGYLSAYPESFIDRVEERKDVWAPWYTLHKIMAGLVDAYQQTDNRQALDTAVKMANWVKFRVDRLPREKMQVSLQTEFGGMGEVLANLYALTGDKTILTLAQAFDQDAVFGPLAQGQDKLDGLHANTQIPKVIGAAREFELTGDAHYRTIVETFWSSVALHRSFAIGGHSDREHFFPVADFAKHLSPETAETCNTYNMLKLTRHLFSWQPDARYMDFYERGLYNHILASQDPARGMFVYLMSLEPGCYKMYSTPEDSFWCCVGTGMENHAKYGDSIYARDDRGLFVNLFIPSTLSWKDRGVTLRQETTFPDEDTTRLTWSCSKPVELAVRVRHPAWSKGALVVSVNGKTEPVTSSPGSYAEIKRTWRDGDRVEIRFDLALHSESLPGVENTVAILYGPIVLAGRLGEDGMTTSYERNQLDQARYPHPLAPALVSDRKEWLSQMEMVSRSPLLFRTHDLVRPKEITLVPFYRVHHERYAAYWRLFTVGAWEKNQQTIASAEKAWKDLPQTSVDFVAVGDADSETAHGFRAEKTSDGTISGRHWRQAQQSGFFSYELKTQGNEKLALACVFGSRDVARRFDVLVNGQKIDTPHLDGTNEGEVFIQRYSLPTEMVAGKPSVTVKFQAASNWDAATANVFGCALVKAE